MKNIGKHLSAILCATAFLCSTPATAWAKEQVPFEGSATGQFVQGTASPTSISQGVASHLGKIGLRTVTQLPPLGVRADEDGNPVITFRVHAELTSANGDKAFAVVVVEQTFFPDGVASLAGESGMITGGTGRFEHATGAISISGIVLPDGSVAIAFDGTISSVGSSRR